MSPPLVAGKPMDMTVATSRSAGLSTMPSAMTLKRKGHSRSRGAVMKQAGLYSPAPLVHNGEEDELDDVLVRHLGGLGPVFDEPPHLSAAEGGSEESLYRAMRCNAVKGGEKQERAHTGGGSRGRASPLLPQRSRRTLTPR